MSSNDTTNTNIVTGAFGGNTFGGMTFNGAITSPVTPSTPSTPAAIPQIGWGFII
jgi:hypothetical protein